MKKLYISAFTLLSVSALSGMDRKSALSGMDRKEEDPSLKKDAGWWGNVTEHWRENWNNFADRLHQQELEERARRDRTIDGWQRVIDDRYATPGQKELAMKQKAALEAEARDARDLENKARNAGVDVAKHLLTTAIDMKKNQQEAEQKKQEAALRAEMMRRGIVQSTEKVLQTLTNPRTAGLAVATIFGSAFGIYAAKHGVQLLVDAYKVPDIFNGETSLLSTRQRLVNYLTGVKRPELTWDDVVFEEGLFNRLKGLSDELRQTVQNGFPLKNIILYGPPGTGKTLVGKVIALQSGLEWGYFSASALYQMPLDKALEQIRGLFAFAKNSSKKLLIIVDEAERLFGHRTRNDDLTKSTLLTEILTHTGTESPHFALVLITNRDQDLDSAYRNRCDDKIEVGAPSVQERKVMLGKYIDKYLIHPEKMQVQPSSWLARLFHTPKTPKTITIEEGALSDKALDTINARIDKFVGRDISKLVLAWQSRASVTENCTLTREMIDAIVTRKIEEKRKDIAAAAPAA